MIHFKMGNPEGYTQDQLDRMNKMVDEAIIDEGEYVEEDAYKFLCQRIQVEFEDILKDEESWHDEEGID